jgi:alpha-D-ribose 1-methylphosphonate 5-triphosphate diphosphatase
MISDHSPDIVIRHARAVTPEAVIPDATVTIVNGRIADVSSGGIAPYGFREIDACDHLLLPGFIDIHSDVIENAIQPRPGGSFPVDVALHELDKQLTACGVTTIFHCLCFIQSDENPPFRNLETTRYIIDEIHSLRSSFSARTFVHGRYEITNTEAFSHVEELISRQRIHFFSFMDHTPGQGQFSDPNHFRLYYTESRGLSDAEVTALIEHRLEERKHISYESLDFLARLCVKHGIRMASHDDDSAAKVDNVRRLGVSLSEFPVTLEAAHAARKHGLLISLGSPNVLRGASLTGNLSGREALRAGLGDILCSDYAPMSLLHAAIQVYREGIMNLPEAVNLISLNPARAVGIEGLAGSIEYGKQADLVLIDDENAVCKIRQTFIAGRSVYCSDHFSQRRAEIEFV